MTPTQKRQFVWRFRETRCGNSVNMSNTHSDNKQFCGTTCIGNIKQFVASSRDGLSLLVCWHSITSNKLLAWLENVKSYGVTHTQKRQFVWRFWETVCGNSVGMSNTRSDNKQFAALHVLKTSIRMAFFEKLDVVIRLTCLIHVVTTNNSAALHVLKTSNSLSRLQKTRCGYPLNMSNTHILKTSNGLTRHGLFFSRFFLLSHLLW